jgi:hypothetical protein
VATLTPENARFCIFQAIVNHTFEIFNRKNIEKP